MNTIILEPMFGADPNHTPAMVAEAVKSVKAGRGCRCCGAGPKPGSRLVCMYCHRVSLTFIGSVSKHDLGPTEHDRMKPAPKPATKAKPKAKVKAKAQAKPAPQPPRLTKEQARSLRAEASPEGVPVDVIDQFLASLEGPGAASIVDVDDDRG